MDQIGAQVNAANPLRSTALKVVENKSFQRAPVMCHLLNYLVDRTIEGQSIKSYTIAIEALGRSEQDLADADTYARVAVGRLRKALVNYFADHPDDDQIYIDPGSYEVRIRHRPKNRKIEIQKFRFFNRLFFESILNLKWISSKKILIAFVIFITSAIAIHFLNFGNQDRWKENDFPTLEIVYEGDVDADSAESEIFGIALRKNLLPYFGFQMIEKSSGRADFELRISSRKLDNFPLINVSLVEISTSRVIWVDQYSIDNAERIVATASVAATDIAAPGGALDEAGHAHSVKADTPYGCWLRWTANVTSYSSMVDEDLHHCAEDWYAADQANPVAAFLRNWTLVNASMTLLSESARKAELEEALDVVHHAIARDPSNGILFVAEMRTYSFLRLRSQVQQAATSAVASAPESRLVTGMVGTWLTFWNDPQGPSILASLEDSSDVNLPWEHAGHFIAAVMRDDVETANMHLGHLRFYMDGQPALNIFEAAYARRAGRPDIAAEALDRLRNHPRAWIVGPEEVMERLPFAPEVLTRLEDWMTYQTPDCGEVCGA
jgi:adenylate cyclase